jgi:hypothetical protein
MRRTLLCTGQANSKRLSERTLIDQVNFYTYLNVLISWFFSWQLLYDLSEVCGEGIYGTNMLQSSLEVVMIAAVLHHGPASG